MKIKTMSKLLIALGMLVMLYALFAMPISLPDTDIVNIHLISERQNTLLFGGLLFLAGVVLFATFKVKQTKEEEESAVLLTKKTSEEVSASLDIALKQIKKIVGIEGVHINAWSDHRVARIANGIFVWLCQSISLANTINGYEWIILIPIVFWLSFIPRIASSVILRLQILNIAAIAGVCFYTYRYGSMLGNHIVYGLVFVVMIGGVVAMNLNKLNASAEIPVKERLNRIRRAIDDVQLGKVIRIILGLLAGILCGMQVGLASHMITDNLYLAAMLWGICILGCTVYAFRATSTYRCVSRLILAVFLPTVAVFLLLTLH